MSLNPCSEAPLHRLLSKLRPKNPAAFNCLLVVAGVTGLVLEAGLLVMLSQMSSDDIASAELSEVEQPLF